MPLKSWHVVTLVCVASTILVMLELPAATRVSLATASLATGVAALALMAVAAILGARWSPVESLFGGLDRVYLVHKWLGIWALGLASFHLAFKAGMRGWETAAIMSLPDGWPRFVRQFSYIGLMFVLLLALNRNIPYSVWRWWHKLSGLALLVVVLHWLSIKQPTALASPAGLWLAGLSLLGLAGAAYKLLFYRLLAGNAEYEVTAIKHGAAAIRLDLKPVRERIDFTPGQFGFLRMHEDGLREPHPFTIASADDDQGRVSFAIRSIGDFTTRLVGSAKVGMRAQIYAPHGRFTRNREAPREVWIGGGVGISPFLAWLDDAGAGGFDKATLFYFYTPGRDFPEVARMQAMAQEHGVELVPVPGGPADTAFTRRFAEICATVPPAELDIAFCGPQGLLHQVRKAMRDHGVPEERLRHELFQFR